MSEDMQKRFDAFLEQVGPGGAQWGFTLTAVQLSSCHNWRLRKGRAQRRRVQLIGTACGDPSPAEVLGQRRAKLEEDSKSCLFSPFEFV